MINTDTEVVCSNDAFDAQMGVDGDKPESIVNLTGNRLGCLWVANSFLAAGCALVFSAMLGTVSTPACLYATGLSLGCLVAHLHDQHQLHDTRRAAQRDLIAIGALVAAIALGYMYQGPPFR